MDDGASLLRNVFRIWSHNRALYLYQYVKCLLKATMTAEIKTSEYVTFEHVK
jgi:hypothetical protein